MMKTRKSWQEKLRSIPKERIVSIPPLWQKRFGKGKMLIPTGLEVNALVRKIPKGKLMTHDQIREQLARENRVDQACPMVTGIQMRIVAEAAEEERRAGKARIAPYWRVIKFDGSLNPKYPGGVVAQGRKLKGEGFEIERGRVKGFDRYLVAHA